MEYGTIERELHVDASPEVVYEVVSSPVHLREWWPDDAEVDAVPGGVGHLIWRDGGTEHPMSVPLTVVEADPPRRFSFRWCHDEGETAVPANSLLVTFDLVAAGEGTLVRLSESGWRELGWEAAVLEAAYQDHVNGWDRHFPRLGVYVARLVSAT